MFKTLLKTTAIVVAATAVTAWALGWGSALVLAQCGCCQHGGSHAGHHTESTGQQPGEATADHSAHKHANSLHAKSDKPQPKAPHGGQLTTAASSTFEVVYLPEEIRVYLYSRLPQPQSAKDATGEISLKRRNDQRATRVALQHVEAGAGQQDYLSAKIDLRRVTDREFTATIQLANLPVQDSPETTFSQSVVVSKGKPRVTLVAVKASDEAGIVRQRVCPVTEAELGSMGSPIKLLVDGKPVYLCCKGCLGKVQRDPDTYLRKASEAGQGSQGGDAR